MTEASQVCVGIVMVDNFDEAVYPVGEEMRGLLTAHISRRLTSFALGLGGIIKAFEKDKYLLILSNEKLDLIRNGRFEILKEIREINMGNKMPITLSIGFGINGDSLAQNMELARAALDLALGRGGDQVLVKDRDKYFFFGGVAREISSNARVRARVKTYAISELMTESKEVLVLGHKKIDLDCFGAAVGIYKIAQSMDKECCIVLDYLNSSITDLHEGLMRHETYKHAFINTENALARLTEDTLIVVVDVHRPSLVESRAVLESSRTKKIVVIDHHRRSTEYIDKAVLTYHEPYASSTCELITEMLQYQKPEAKLLPVEADALLAGITVDTKNFTTKTGARTFEAASYLKRNGADPARVRLLLKSSMQSFLARTKTVSNAEITADGFAVSVYDSDAENPTVIAAQAADELLNIYGIKASFVLCMDEHSVVNISARSLGEINVQVIMEKLGGGGHQTVAGAQFTNADILEIKQRLLDAIKTYMKENINEGYTD